MDEAHTLQAARYIELNPVEAGLVERAREYQWSSAAAHGLGRDDALVSVKPLLEMVGKGQWGRFLAKPSPAEEWEQLRRHERTGRPLGGNAFVAHLESVLNRELRLQKRGPKGPWKHTRKHSGRSRTDRRGTRRRAR
jgi:putative transposase